MLLRMIRSSSFGSEVFRKMITLRMHGSNRNSNYLKKVVTDVTLSLVLVLINSIDVYCRTSPVYPYSDKLIYHLVAEEQAIYYDKEKFVVPVDDNCNYLGEGHISFDKNGNVLSYDLLSDISTYKYTRKGYDVYDAQGNRMSRWKVVCDTAYRIRKDIYLEKYPREKSYTYSFDTKGRHKSTLFMENQWKVLVIYHYPDEPAFKPGRLWKARNYGRINGSQSSVWYFQVDRDGGWLEEQHPNSNTSYYTAHCVLSEALNGGEGVILREKIKVLKSYRNNHNWERSHLTRIAKRGNTEFEKALASLGVFHLDGILLAEKDAIKKSGRNPYMTKDSGNSSWTIMKAGADSLINQRFLFKYISISQKSQNIICNILCVILCLAALFYANSIFSKDVDDITYKSLGDVIGGRIFLLLFALSELAFFYICPDAEGFISKLKGVWTLLPLAGILILFIGQLGSTIRLLNLGNYFSGRNAPYDFMYFGFIIYMLGLIISLFAENLRSYVIIIGFGTIAFQILIDLVATIVNKASLIQFLFHSMWMIVVCSAIMLLSYAFAVLFVLVFIGYAILSGLAHSGDPRCSNCRTYCDGICYVSIR